MAALLAYDWPGNVRELENAMERAVLLSEGATVLPESLPEKLWGPKAAVPRGGEPGGSEAAQLASGLFRDLSLKRANRELEEAFIRAALRRTHGNRTRAAELLEQHPADDGE